MTDVSRIKCFIAYPSPARGFAKQLANRLGTRLSVFVDYRDIRLGSSWPEALASELNNAHLIVVVVTPDTERAYYEQEEIARAIDRARAEPDFDIVPLFVGLAPSDKRVPYGLRARNGLAMESASGVDSAAEGFFARATVLAATLADEKADSEPRDVSELLRSHLAQVQIEADHLTKEQYRAIRLLRHMRLVRVSGCAGSGKTLVACEKAVRLSQADSRVLFVCHNPLLAEHVQRLTAGSGVDVRDFARWVAEIAEEPPAESSTWTHYEEPNQGVIDRAFASFADVGGQYDAVIVDEGQDFRAEWWPVIEAALKHPSESHLYIFHDNNQSLLSHRAQYPFDEPHVDLSRNCRNAARVFELMRCFDSSAPERELSLRSRGHVILSRCEFGDPIPALSSICARLDRDQLLANTVVLIGGNEVLEASPFATASLELPSFNPWQDEVRDQFRKALHIYDDRGVVVPRGGESWIYAELEKLSESPYPSPADLELVNQVANAFAIDRDIRTRVSSNPDYRDGFAWRLSGRTPQMRRQTRGPVWSAEIIIHFESPNWTRGLPRPKQVTLKPFYRNEGENSIPLYRIPDFKGLEADAVIMILRGRTQSAREMTYVGISRARALLYVLADSGALGVFPRTFRWDVDRL